MASLFGRQPRSIVLAQMLGLSQIYHRAAARKIGQERRHRFRRDRNCLAVADRLVGPTALGVEEEVVA
jgi:hypothetical protein